MSRGAYASAPPAGDAPHMRRLREATAPSTWAAGVTAAALACAVALAAAAGVGAAERAGPWSGGEAVVTPLEARLGAIAGRYAARATAVHCDSPARWHAWTTTYGWRTASAVSAFVPAVDGRATGAIHVSPLVCELNDAFLADPRRERQKACGSRARGSRAPHGRCARYSELVDAIQTIGHETAHVAGVVNEAAAECAGLQLAPLVASGLGATSGFAYEIGRDYLPLYRLGASTNAEYATDRCFDGGPYDLWPSLRGWPTPAFATAAGSHRLRVVAPALGPLVEL